MAKKKNPAPRYRDRRTGRFVSKETWQRSRARGGVRFKRERIVSKETRQAPRTPKPTKRPRPRALPKPQETTIGELVPEGYNILVHEETSTHPDFDSAVKKLFRLRRNNPDPEFFVRIARRKGKKYDFETWAKEIEFGGAFDSP